MKKILTLFILTTVLMLAFSVCAYAEEVVTEVEGAEETVSMSTVYEKAVEWWKVNENEIASIASLGATALFGLLYGKIKTGIKDLIGKNGMLVNATATSTKATGDLIVGYNSQVDEIKALRSENAALQAINQENAKEIVVIKHEIAHIAHILTTVYTNSKALPQGVRDMVNLECAECMRLAGTGDGINEDIEKN